MCKLMWGKKSYYKEITMLKKTKCANQGLEKIPEINKRRAFNKAVGPGKKLLN